MYSDVETFVEDFFWPVVQTFNESSAAVAIVCCLLGVLSECWTVYHFCCDHTCKWRAYQTLRRRLHTLPWTLITLQSSHAATVTVTVSSVGPVGLEGYFLSSITSVRCGDGSSWVSVMIPRRVCRKWWRTLARVFGSPCLTICASA